MVLNTVALERNINIMFNKAYDGFINNQGIVEINGLVTRVPSTKSEEKYGWLGDVPAMQEWLSDKDSAGLEDYDYTIKNKDWYASIAIDRNEIEDDQYGMIKPRIESLALTAANFPMELVATLIKEGDTRLAYDGSAYFANRAINDNLLAGTGTTLAQLKADLSSARVAMQRFLSDTGKILRLKPNVIVCPPELEVSFMELVQSTSPQDSANYNSAGKNPWSTWITDVISLPDLTDTDDWYLFNTTMPLKPFFYQDRKKPQSVLDDTQVKRNRKLEYSVELRGNAGYGFPQMGIKMVN